MDERTGSVTVSSRAARNSRVARQTLVGLLAGACLLLLGCTTGQPTQAKPAAKPAAQRDMVMLGRIEPAPNVPGDPMAGRQLFFSAGCAGCHTTDGVPGATGVSGPNLTNVVIRPTLAGDTIPMTPDTLTAFLLNPSSLKPGTEMPAVGLTEEEARHIAAFLYSQPYNAVSR